MEAMNMYQSADSIGFTFGSFELVPTRRLLSKDGRIVKVGSRALDLLIALIERAGQIVTKEELMSQVWSNVIVEDTNLRVHVSALRRLLGDDGINSRYIVHVARRGYVFVAPLHNQRFSADTAGFCSYRPSSNGFVSAALHAGGERV
jgi:DNA-binding winged helix-turn-helix (wHTH) protein